MAMQIWSLKQPRGRGGGGVAWPTAEAPVIADITIVEVELSVSRERIKPFLLQ